MFQYYHIYPSGLRSQRISDIVLDLFLEITNQIKKELHQIHWLTLFAQNGLLDRESHIVKFNDSKTIYHNINGHAFKNWTLEGDIFEEKYYFAGELKSSMSEVDKCNEICSKMPWHYT